MLARMRKSIDDNDEGFTLIELLVVMIIIGILAAIAIPVFLNQRKSGYDASAKSDAHNAALAEESFFTDNQNYVNFAGLAGLFKQSANTTAVVITGQTGGTMGTSGTVLTTDTGYKVSVTSKSGNFFCWDSANSDKGVYKGATVAC